MNYYNQRPGPHPSPPPASAPPRPPVDNYGSQPFPVNSVNLQEFSYQTPYGRETRPGLTPKVSEDYGLSSSYLNESRDGGYASAPIDGSNLPHMRGDANIRPNTGNSNQSAGDPLGSLQEITTFLRWTTIVSTGAAIVWEFFAFPPRLIGVFFLADPSQVVLGAYLAFFCLLVLGAEFNSPVLQDKFGFLYYPLSRGFILLLMSGMCLGVLNLWWESLLGIAFGSVGIGYVYTYIKYPEYRRWNHYNERMPTAWQEAKMYWYGESSVRTASWADTRGNSNLTPMAAQAAMQGFANASETQSLLNTV
eukprot:CAMPEP_0116134750 /NCGR_PEP_ID=MMETSP0329-20121206/10817_1 /TAXON_ID=697910 /ORGANISM="Pseudo-nitzschia arenysensis, Strain B593" /LENGTH=305 /DNA_ID=CAMNT_0003629491 /DNA_START=431 /DNA_END=1348 /DNA_ORIENTATION=+